MPTLKTANETAKPSKALSRDDTRPTLQTANLRELNGGVVLEATNSYQAVRVPMNTDGRIGEPLRLPAPAVKLLDGRNKSLTIEGREIVAGNGDGTRTLFDPADHGTFPDFDSLWVDTGGAFRVGINVSQLSAISAALGSDSVEIRFLPEHVESDTVYTRAMVVRPTAAGAAGEGLLMPVRIN